MFNKSVVFVIGAGASHEYNFPLGSSLKDKVAKKVRFRFDQGSSHLVGGDPDLLDHIRRHVTDTNRRNDYTRATNVLASAIPSYISIDEALHYVSGSPEAVEVGKIAIMLEILEAERNSALAISRQNGRLDINGLDDRWIAEMFSMAIAGLQREALDTAFDKVTFINFNYDRAIEHYLYWALQERTSASSDEARRIVEKLNFIRPYGSIGPLSWNTNDDRSFGTTAYFDPFSRIGLMRTYTDKEQLHDASAMTRALEDAKLIIFLGFGYHATNVDLLKTAPNKSAAEVLGTFFKIHEGNRGVIGNRIVGNLRIPAANVSLVNMSAAALLRDLRQSILINLE